MVEQVSHGLMASVEQVVVEVLEEVLLQVLQDSEVVQLMVVVKEQVEQFQEVIQDLLVHQAPEVVEVVHMVLALSVQPVVVVL
jgi:hypothetical protein